MLLLPEDSSSTCCSYIGLLQVKHRQYPVRVVADPDAVQFACDPALAQLLHAAPQTLDLIRQKIAHYGRLGSISALALELQDIAERVVSCLGDEHRSVHAPCELLNYERIIREIGDIGWEKLCSIDPSLTLLQFNYQDSRGRTHLFSFRLPTDYPLSGPNCTVDIPEEFELVWSKRSTLLDGIRQVESLIQQYDQFWTVLEDFDQNCWVIEPENPSRSAKSRRLAIDRYSSIIVDIDCKTPYRLCSFRFLGPDSIVDPFKEKLVNKASSWNDSVLPRENLEQILGIAFPSRKGSEVIEEFQLECGICYAKDRDGAIPDRCCDNVRCAHPFHSACLLEWLTSVPNCRRSFSTVFGTCPYCSTAITATAR